MALATEVGFVQGHDWLLLRQTDASATHGQSAACSGAGATADTGNDIALAEGGTPGVTPRTITVAGSATEAAIFMESGAVGQMLWNAGVWNVSLNVTTANALVSLEAIHICRVNSSGVSQATVASRTAMSRPLSSTGVQSIPIPQANDHTGADATDRIYVVVTLMNSDAGSQAIAITPNGFVNTPIRTTIRVAPRKQRARSRGLGFVAMVEVEVIPPSVEEIQSVTPPPIEVEVWMPPQIRVRPPYTMRSA